MEMGACTHTCATGDSSMAIFPGRFHMFHEALLLTCSKKLLATRRAYIQIPSRDGHTLAVLLKCPRLLYQSQCESSVDFSVSAGMRSGAGDAA